MRRLFIAAWTASPSANIAIACAPPQGPAGTVVDKDRHYKASAKHWTYELTTRDKDGFDHDFRASHSDYNDCVRGAKYPKCIQD